MRVAFVTTSLDPGGAETALVALALGLVNAGIETSVMALRGSGRLVEQLRVAGVAVSEGKQGGAGAVALRLPHVIGELCRFSPDIVQGWMYHGNLVATAAVPLSGGRLHWGIRQALGALDRESAATNRLIRFGAWVSRRPQRIVYNSQRARVDHETIGYARDAGTVVANGFDTAAFCPNMEARLRLRTQLNLAEADVLIGHVARYHPIKDHETFLLAAANVVRSDCRAQVLMAGRGIDVTNVELLATINHLGLAGRVSLRGEVDDVGALLPGLDVLCVSSRSEAFPNVLAEAMSCGVVCVATDVGDTSQIVGGTGQVVPPGQPDPLADALRSIAQLDPGERARRGLAARQRIVDHYSLESMIDQYKHLYSSSLRQH